jgi:hypothetical protein
MQAVCISESLGVIIKIVVFWAVTPRCFVTEEGAASISNLTPNDGGSMFHGNVGCP